jgi:hypothetical protein
MVSNEPAPPSDVWRDRLTRVGYLSACIVLGALVAIFLIQFAVVLFGWSAILEILLVTCLTVAGILVAFLLILAVVLFVRRR